MAGFGALPYYIQDVGQLQQQDQQRAQAQRAQQEYMQKQDAFRRDQAAKNSAGGGLGQLTAPPAVQPGQPSMPQQPQQQAQQPQQQAPQPQGLDVSRLTPQQAQQLMKMNPQAFQAGIQNFQQTNRQAQPFQGMPTTPPQAPPQQGQQLNAPPPQAQPQQGQQYSLQNAIQVLKSREPNLSGADLVDRLAYMMPVLDAQAKTEVAAKQQEINNARNVSTDQRAGDKVIEDRRRFGIEEGDKSADRAQRERLAKEKINGTAAPSVNSDLHGADYLKTLSTSDAAIVKQIAEGRGSLTSLSTKGGHRERIMAMVDQYKPDYDAKVYGTEAAGEKAFTIGKQGDQGRAINVSKGHLNLLNELSTALNNKDTKLFNKIGNKWVDEMGGTAPSNFNAVKDLVAGEIVKGATGGLGGVEDRAKAASKIDAAKSPQQLKEAIAIYQSAINEQQNGLRKQYEAATNKKDYNERFMLPSKNSGPKAGTVEDGHVFKGGNPADKNNWTKQ